MEFGFKGRPERLSVKLSAVQGFRNGTDQPEWKYWPVGADSRNQTLKLVFGMKIPARRGAPGGKGPAAPKPAAPNPPAPK